MCTLSFGKKGVLLYRCNSWAVFQALRSKQNFSRRNYCIKGVQIPVNWKVVSVLSCI
ncbi:hypothetical protein APHMUC_0331 [Anaplasma phagocytophilum str. ApMUC09]|uniref:Uncharacterized protein n=1 Tax=Anaplasma phagocytophilum str. ApMUC09 TaxID=1359152 RepID=A0A0F3N825_ANAPH|nr:hypothetical protein APHMUC_0331 [Anaplasma phagocytophilum str. ApMUC09]